MDRKPKKKEADERYKTSVFFFSNHFYMVRGRNGRRN